MKNIRILIGHPYWGRGGAEIATMWMLQSLLQDYQVDVVTRGGWDLDELNLAAGTNIQRDTVQVHYAPFSNRRFAGALWLGCFYRFCRKIASQYDLCITASRVIDWGVPAIHFLSDVTWHHTLQNQFYSAEFHERKGLLRSVYWKLGDLIAGKSGRAPEQHDLFIANSQWTAQYAATFCCKDVNVIYPPVPGKFDNLMPWNERENTFVCLGRISEEKNIEQVISILELVRETYPSITLRIVGHFDDTPYCQFILNLCESRNDWITVHNGLYGEEKENLLGRCRYGLSACKREAFGIATAEMIKAGVIPFVPKEGAQRELLMDKSLSYESNDDAAKKIRTVLASTTNQMKLHLENMQSGTSFSTEKFSSKVNVIVQYVLSHRRVCT